MSYAATAAVVVVGPPCCMWHAREAVPALPGLCRSCRYLRAALPGFRDRILAVLRDASAHLCANASAVETWFHTGILLFKSCEPCRGSAEGWPATACSGCNIPRPGNCSRLLQAAEPTCSTVWVEQLASDSGVQRPHHCNSKPANTGMCKQHPKKTTRIFLMCSVCLLQCRPSSIHWLCRGFAALRNFCGRNCGSAACHVRAVRVMGS